MDNLDDELVPAAVRRIQAKVDTIAEGLLRDGLNPTVARVRERLGGGSPNVVAPALRRWRHAYAARLSDDVMAASEVVPPAVRDLLVALWQRALFEAHRIKDENREVPRLDVALAEVRTIADRLLTRERELEAERAALDRKRRSPRPRAQPRGAQPGKVAQRKPRARAKVARPKRAARTVDKQPLSRARLSVRKPKGRGRR